MITTHKPTARIFEQLFAEDNLWDTRIRWQNKNQRIYFGFLLNHPISRDYVLADRNFQDEYLRAENGDIFSGHPAFLKSLGPDKRKAIHEGVLSISHNFKRMGRCHIRCF